MNIGKLASD